MHTKPIKICYTSKKQIETTRNILTRKHYYIINYVLLFPFSTKTCVRKAGNMGFTNEATSPQAIHSIHHVLLT